MATGRKRTGNKREQKRFAKRTEKKANKDQLRQVIKNYNEKAITKEAFKNVVAHLKAFGYSPSLRKLHVILAHWTQVGSRT